MSPKEVLRTLTDREKMALQVLMDKREVFKSTGQKVAEKTMTIAIVLLWQVYCRTAGGTLVQAFTTKLEAVLDEYARQVQQEHKPCAWMVNGEVFKNMEEAVRASPGDLPRALMFEDHCIEKVRSAFRRGAIFGDMRKSGSRGD